MIWVEFYTLTSNLISLLDVVICDEPRLEKVRALTIFFIAYGPTLRDGNSLSESSDQ